ARLQHLGEVNAVALAAREEPDLLLLVRALEVEGADIGAARHGGTAKLDDVGAARDFLPDGHVGIERVAALVDITHDDGLADLERAAVGLLLPGEHAEERGLAGAVRADDADDAAGRQLEGKIVDQELVAEALGDVLGLVDIAAETRAR